MWPISPIVRTFQIKKQVHGTAPDIAGQNKANPTALLLSAVMMLRYMEWTEAADKIETAIMNVLKKRETVTADLGGKASTTEYTAAIIKELKALWVGYSASSIPLNMLYR